MICRLLFVGFLWFYIQPFHRLCPVFWLGPCDRGVWVSSSGCTGVCCNGNYGLKIIINLHNYKFCRGLLCHSSGVLSLVSRNAGVHYRGHRNRICGRRSGTAAGLSASISVLFCQLSTLIFCILICHQGLVQQDTVKVKLSHYRPVQFVRVPGG